jgi:hypothetical protein
VCRESTQKDEELAESKMEEEKEEKPGRRILKFMSSK